MYTGSANAAVVGVFESRARAQEAVGELRRAGFREDEIGVLTRSDADVITDPTHTRWEEGTGLGAAAGGATGLSLGMAVAAGLMPPLGPVLAGGTLVALLASAGTGAAVGSVVGGLVGLGVPEEDAKWYEGELNAGRVLVAVQAPAGRADEARNVIRKLGGSVHEAAGVGSYGTGLPATPY